MKYYSKLILCILLTILLCNCSNDYPYTNDKTKEKIITESLSENEEIFINAVKEKEKIIEELNGLAANKDKKAIEELKKWDTMNEKIMKELLKKL